MAESRLATLKARPTPLKAGPTPAGNPAPPEASASLSSDIVRIVLGNGFFNACRLLAIAVLAKYSTPEIVGELNYGLAISSPLVLFFALELRSVFITDVEGGFSFGTYRTTRSLGLSCAALVLAGLVLLRVSQQPGIAWTLIVAGACAGRVALQSAEVYWGVYQRRGRLDLLAWSNALRGAAMLLPFAIVLPLYALRVGRGEWPAERLAEAAACAIGLHVILWVLIEFGFDRRRVSAGGELDRSWSWSAVRRLAWRGLPLGLVALLISLSENVPRLLVERSSGGRAALGYFGAIGYLPLAAQFLIVQAGLAASQRLATHFHNDHAAFVRLARKLVLASVGVGVAVLAVAWLIGPWLLRALYTADYAQHSRAFVILMLAQCVLLPASMFGFITTQMRRFWVQVPLQLSVLAATAAAGLWFIPSNPVEGGAWTQLARAATHTLLYGACVALALRGWRRSAGSIAAGRA